MNLTALIVTYNRLDKLKKTVKATLELPFRFVVIVNNASTDSTQLWLDDLTDKRLHIIHNKVNNGGAGGFRVGSEYICTSLTTDWVVFYDDDAYPKKNFFEEFNRINTQSGTIYCSRIVDLLGNDCKMNIPWMHRPKSLLDNLRYISKPASFIVDVNEKAVALTFSFVGSIIDISVLKNTYQLIEEALFIYYDDVYFAYCLTCRKHSILYEPSLIFYHDINISDGYHGLEWKVYYLIRNLFLGRHLYGRKCFYTPTAIFLRCLKYLIYGMKSQNKKKYYQYFSRGLVDGLRNISGKRH